jgi:hypothetical protein
MILKNIPSKRMKTHRKQTHHFLDLIGSVGVAGQAHLKINKIQQIKTRYNGSPLRRGNLA